MEPLLMIRLPRGCWPRITRNASRVQRNAPGRLTATTAFHSWSGMASRARAGGKVPALLNSTSTRPCRWTARSNRARTEASSVTSAGTGSSTPGTPPPPAPGAPVGDAGGARVEPPGQPATPRGDLLEGVAAAAGQDHRPALAGEGVRD